MNFFMKWIKSLTVPRVPTQPVSPKETEVPPIASFDKEHEEDEFRCKIDLLRYGSFSEMGTFGQLTFQEFKCYTVELPWRNNQPNISCIPAGLYLLELTVFNGKYSTFELKNVPDRTLIKIHIANTVDDLLGCIGPGSSFGWLRNKLGVVNSTKTFKRFWDAVNAYAKSEIKRMGIGPGQIKIYIDIKWDHPENDHLMAGHFIFKE